jgi:hypothetical protein
MSLSAGTGPGVLYLTHEVHFFEPGVYSAYTILYRVLQNKPMTNFDRNTANAAIGAVQSPYWLLIDNKSIRIFCAS